MKPSYVYLLCEREFIKTGENIYKIGITKKENLTRFNQYPKDSILLLQIHCNNCKLIEKQILNIFKDQFINRTDIGNEYFQGDCNVMKKIICDLVNTPTNNNCNYNEKDTDSDIETYEIDSYEEWLKYSNINKIVIINKKTNNIYIQFKNNNNWYKIDKYNETIHGFIENNKIKTIRKIIKPILKLMTTEEFYNFIIKYKHKITNEIISYDEYEKLMDNKDDYIQFTKKDYTIKYLQVIYNNNKIYKDIMKKCYDPSFNPVV